MPHAPTYGSFRCHNMRRWMTPGCGLLVLLFSMPLPIGQAEDDIGFRAELIFPPHAQHNHAPGIAELADGSLIVSWYRGSGERTADDVAVWGARKSAGSPNWTPPFLMADTPGFPDCNTTLMTDREGRLFLFWPVILANSWESGITRMRVSSNPAGSGCPTWDRDEFLLLRPDDFSAEAIAALDALVATLPQPLPGKLAAEIAQGRIHLADRLHQRLGWQPRNKPLRLATGRILLPLYSDTFSLSLMAISDDDGGTWYAGRPTLGFGAIQPALVQKQNGDVVAFLRENGFSGKVRTAVSTDEGVTWGAVTSMELPNPGSGLDALVLRNGHWLIVFNDTTEGRSSLAVTISTDEGAHWGSFRHLEQHASGAYHYPAVIQTRDEHVHFVYSHFREEGKSMKHVDCTETWLMTADP